MRACLEEHHVRAGAAKQQGTRLPVVALQPVHRFLPMGTSRSLLPLPTTRTNPWRRLTCSAVSPTSSETRSPVA